MDHKTLENLIIVVLIIAILYMLFKKEYLDVSSNQQNAEKEKQNIIPISIPITNVSTLSETISKLVETKSAETKSAETKTAETKPVEISQKNDEIYGYDGVSFAETEKFLKEYREYGRLAKPIQKITSDDDINAYRKSFLDFRNYTNQDSHGFDAVDGMNLENISKLNSTGMSVADVYDRIAANNYKKENIDIIGMQHNEKRDVRLIQNEFNYDSDTVNNGGFFFDKILASDKENETYMVL
jgi:hypothetical protein